MTAQELVSRLVDSPKGITPDRIAKAKARAEACGIMWSAIEALIPKETEGSPRFPKETEGDAKPSSTT